MQFQTRFPRKSGALALAGLALGCLSGCMTTDDAKKPDPVPVQMEEVAKTVTVTVKSKVNPFTSQTSGRYGTAAATPGNAHTWEFNAPKGAKLSFASMFGQSNDWFWAPDTNGIALYDAAGNPLTQDVTNQVQLWDAGTEEDQPALQGSNQAPRQPAPGTGPADPNPNVRLVSHYPVGTVGTSAAKPGDSLSWDFTPPKGSHISFVTMFGQSNDWFFAPDTSGIELWDANGVPKSGNITSQVTIWDAGTELDETPFSGPNQAPRQAAPNTGALDTNNLVRLVADTNFFGKSYKYIDANLYYLDAGKFRITIKVLPTSKTPISPIVYQVFRGRHTFFTTGKPDKGRGLEHLAEDGNPTQLAHNIEGYDFQNPTGNIQVSITSLGSGRFQGRILATDNGITPVAPGSYSIHLGKSPLFTPGAVAPEGLEHLAEEGDPADHAAWLAKSTGAYTLLSPIVYAVSKENDVMFTEGSADMGKGLEALAEDGNPATLAAYLTSLGIQAGAAGMKPIQNGEAISFDIKVKAGDKLHFATMFGQSNDVFFGPDGTGILLADTAGVLKTGDVTAQVELWDAGTEVNEPPGVGANQAPRQIAPNTGVTEMGVVKSIKTLTTYPAVGSLMQVTLTAK
jgi:hypothetical protein